MTDDFAGTERSRRWVLRSAAATAAAGAAATASPVAGQQERPDWGGWLDGVDGGYQDARGEGAVSVAVGAEGNNGNFAFSPAGLWVDPGTTVTWEWTGQGGAHNVVAREGPADLDSGEPAAGEEVTYEFTFEEGQTGITKYVCEPHEDLGMLGAVAVGDDVPTTGGDGTPAVEPAMPPAAKAVTVAVAAAMGSTLALAYAFIKFGGGGPHDESA